MEAWRREFQRVEEEGDEEGFEELWNVSYFVNCESADPSKDSVQCFCFSSSIHFKYLIIYGVLKKMKWTRARIMHLIPKIYAGSKYMLWWDNLFSTYSESFIRRTLVSSCRWRFHALYTRQTYDAVFVQKHQDVLLHLFLKHIWTSSLWGTVSFMELHTTAWAAASLAIGTLLSSHQTIEHKSDIFCAFEKVLGILY